MFRRWNLLKNYMYFILIETTNQILINPIWHRKLFLQLITQLNLTNKNIFQKAIKIPISYCHLKKIKFQKIIYQNFKTQPQNTPFHNISKKIQAYYKTSLVIHWDNLLKMPTNIRQMKCLIRGENLHQPSLIVTRRDYLMITDKM